MLPYVGAALAIFYVLLKFIRGLIDGLRAIGRAISALRRHVARRFSSPKDLSQFDLSETLGKRKPKWQRSSGQHLETQPLNAESPMFSPTRSRYARVAAAAESPSDEELLSGS